MNILFFNFRDIKHSAVGGSEKVLHRIAENWVKKRHEVTIFAPCESRNVAEEEIEGVKIIRRGGRYTLYIHAILWWFREGRHKKYDVVVDMVNTIPFFTPLFVRGPKLVAFFHQLARPVWFYETRFPISLIGYLLEPLYLQVYRKTPTIAMSPSTRADLVGLGFQDVTVIPEAIDEIPISKLPKKPKEPTLIFVGRMVPSKRPAHVYKAFKILSSEFPKSRLVFCGSGVPKVSEELREAARQDGLGKRVYLAGWVKGEEKKKYMREAWTIAVTSVREGWGLIVTEANSQGTPAVVYNIHGLRDAVRNGETGIVTHTTPEALAEGIRMLWKHPKLYKMMQKNAWEWSKGFSWNKTANAAMRVLLS
jgi:glycosyltransferase involved in cell wall biosynthesis